MNKNKSKFTKVAATILIFELLIIIVANVIYLKNDRIEERIYRIEANRIEDELDIKTPSEIDLNKYKHIIKVSEFEPEKICNNDYMVVKANDILYRIEYKNSENNNGLLYLNLSMAIVLIGTILGCIYIKIKIINPFHKMEELTRELARGNLSVPLKEDKNKLFGKFLWGLDMLRENLEDSKKKELDLLKEKKELILSLSHDIKTPLSAMELYGRALSDNLYDSEEKKNEAINGIRKNITEIKNYINEITEAARKDIVFREVNNKEIYLSEVIDYIKKYYCEKLEVIHTEFKVVETDECMITADKDRLIEVIQNVMENAIKYGDGEKIHISFAEEEDCKLIKIENTGVEINDTEMPNLFDSFYRGSNSEGVEGSGLGLYICKSLMRRMDGEIFARTDGDKFVVVLVVRKI